MICTDLIDIPHDYEDARLLYERWNSKTDIPTLSNAMMGYDNNIILYTKMVAIAQEQAAIVTRFIDELYPQTCDPDYQCVFHSADEERYQHNSTLFLQLMKTLEAQIPDSSFDF